MSPSPCPLRQEGTNTRTLCQFDASISQVPGRVLAYKWTLNDGYERSSTTPVFGGWAVSCGVLPTVRLEVRVRLTIDTSEGSSHGRGRSCSRTTTGADHLRPLIWAGATRRRRTCPRLIRQAARAGAPVHVRRGFRSRAAMARAARGCVAKMYAVAREAVAGRRGRVGYCARALSSSPGAVAARRDCGSSARRRRTQDRSARVAGHPGVARGQSVRMASS